MARTLARLITLMILISCVAETAAQDSVFTLSPKMRVRNLPFHFQEKVPAGLPVIGLVLSGGGARGLAQIGVLRALEEAGIRPDLITGTSMGSINGGLYAAGYLVDELDSLARAAEWRDILSADFKGDRRELFIDQKISADRAVLSLRLDGFNPILPNSINDGQKLSNYLTLLALNAPLKIPYSFDSLEIPFSAVCTDLETGEAVILKQGSLSLALRASASASFLLAPVKVDSQLLVDGGLVANTPVSIAKDEGAEFVIAVNTTSPLNSKELLELPWMVADQVLSIPMKKLDKSQLLQADVIIEPEISFRATDFDSLNAALRAGYEKGKEKLPAIRAELMERLKATLISENATILTNILPPADSAAGYDFIASYAGRDSVYAGEVLFDLVRFQQQVNADSVYAGVRVTGAGTEVVFHAVPKPKITQVTILGNTRLDDLLQNGVLASYIYTDFCGAKGVRIVKSIIREYKRRGYSLAEADNADFDPATGIFTVSVSEGIIDSLIIKGNTKTDQTVITREIPLAQGSYFNSEAMERGLRNLRSTNLFENIVLYLERSDNRNTVTVDVKERESGILRLGFKLADENTPRVNMDIRDENIFGSGSELGGNFLVSPRDTRLRIEHRSNRVFNTFLTYNINAYYQSQIVYTYKDSSLPNNKGFEKKRTGEYKQDFAGMALAVGTQVGRFANLIAELRYEQVRIRNIENSVVTPYNEPVFAIRISANLDTQDKYPYPSQGVKLNAYYESATSFLGAEVGYVKFGGEYQGYFSIARDHTVGVGFRIGFADKTLPLPFHFGLGGQSQFFGMREYEFRGRQLFTGSVEYRYFLPFQIFFDTYVSARYDLGSVWEQEEAIRFADLRHGVGLTLSLSTPIGPADFSVGRSFLINRGLLDNPLSLGPVYFYFSIGYYY